MPDLVQKDGRVAYGYGPLDSSMRDHPSTIDDLAIEHSKPAAIPTSLSKIIQIVEPHEFVRGCLGFWLRDSCPEFEIMATRDLECLVEQGAAGRIAVVVIGSDVFQRRGEWLEEQLARFRLRLHNVPVVAIVADDMVSETEDWTDRLGLSGYILTSGSTEVASAALRLVIAGGTYFPRTTGHSRLCASAPDEATHGLPRNYMVQQLTLRELAVLECLCQGRPNKLIAHELNMSLSTVKAHVHNIIRKLRVKNRTEVAVAGRALQPKAVSGR